MKPFGNTIHYIVKKNLNYFGHLIYMNKFNMKNMTN